MPKKVIIKLDPKKSQQRIKVTEPTQRPLDAKEIADALGAKIVEKPFVQALAKKLNSKQPR